MANNRLSSHVLGNNVSCESGSSRDNDVANQEMEPALTINRKWSDVRENRLWCENWENCEMERWRIKNLESKIIKDFTQWVSTEE